MPVLLGNDIHQGALSLALRGQGLTLLHFSAQLGPCLTHHNTLHTLNTP
jgi:hypothetical protein